MSAPLEFRAPNGGICCVDTPMLGWRLEGVRADAVRAGHFTTYSGYRRVMSVAEGWVTRGRGKNRCAHLVSITLERSDGSADKLDPWAELTIYAPDAA